MRSCSRRSLSSSFFFLTALPSSMSMSNTVVPSGRRCCLASITLFWLTLGLKVMFWSTARTAFAARLVAL